ncbi:MAG: condensation domain-containing protein, partial [Mycobacteriales bacterium]
SYRGGYVPVRLGPGSHRALRELAQHAGASLFMVLHAGLAAVLSRLGAGEDIPVGSPVAGRTDQALGDLVGLFVNNLVLRTDVSGNPTFAQLLSRVRETALAAYAHQDVPFEYLVEVLNPSRSLARNPLFQVVLNLLSFSEAEFDLPGLDVAPFWTTPPLGVAKFDLTVRLVERRGVDGVPEGIEGFIDYATDLFDRATVESLAARLVRLLDAVAIDPDQPIGRVELLTPDERARLSVDCDGTAAVVSHACLPALFEAQVRATPDAVAVVFENDTATYAELNAAANRLAYALIARGVGPERIVALAIPRSVELVVALLAVLKAGGAYLPVDPGYPPERVGFMLEHARPALLLTGVRAAACVPDADATPRWVIDGPDTVTVLGEYPDTDPTDADRTVALRSEHPACVIYTFGSTDVSEGVVVCHAGVAGCAVDQIERLE